MPLIIKTPPGFFSSTVNKPLSPLKYLAMQIAIIVMPIIPINIPADIENTTGINNNEDCVVNWYNTIATKLSAAKRL